HRVINAQNLAARCIDLVVTTNLARRARFFVVIISATSAQQPLLATLARVSHKRSTDARQTHFTIGLENRPDDQALEIVETHVFVTKSTEDDRARLAVEHALRFDGRGEAVNRRLVYARAEDVDWISLFVEPLHDAHRSAVDGRTEETRDRRVALILDRSRQGRELRFVVTRKARIEILETHQLLPAAGAQTHRALSQPVHQIHVADLKQTERARVTREAATVIHHPRLLLFHVDNHVAPLVTTGRFTRRLGANDHLAVSVREVKLAFRI